jgi:hypothetical protein
MTQQTISDQVELAPISLPHGRALIVTARRRGKLRWSQQRGGYGYLRLRPHMATLTQGGQPVQQISLDDSRPVRTVLLINGLAILAAVILGLIWKKDSA